MRVRKVRTDVKRWVPSTGTAPHASVVAAVKAALEARRAEVVPFRPARIHLTSAPGVPLAGSVRIEPSGWVLFAPDEPWDPKRAERERREQELQAEIEGLVAQEREQLEHLEILAGYGAEEVARRAALRLPSVAQERERVLVRLDAVRRSRAARERAVDAELAALDPQDDVFQVSLPREAIAPNGIEWIRPLDGDVTALFAEESFR